MKVRTLNRGFNEDKALSSVSLVMEIRLSDDTFLRHHVLRRPLSNLGYGHAIEEGYSFTKATVEEINEYLSKTFKELSAYSDEDIAFFKFTWSALDSSHGRLTRSINSEDNPSFTKALDTYRKGSKVILSWAKLQ